MSFDNVKTYDGSKIDGFSCDVCMFKKKGFSVS